MIDVSPSNLGHLGHMVTSRACGDDTISHMSSKKAMMTGMTLMSMITIMREMMRIRIVAVEKGECDDYREPGTDGR